MLFDHPHHIDIVGAMVWAAYALGKVQCRYIPASDMGNGGRIMGILNRPAAQIVLAVAFVVWAVAMLSGLLDGCA